MSGFEQAYIDALKVELSRARDDQHAAEIKAELKRVGAAVEEAVETAAAVPQVEKATAPRQRKAKA